MLLLLLPLLPLLVLLLRRRPHPRRGWLPLIIPAALPALVSRARLGVDLKKASITYLDQATGLTSRVQDLNLILKDISLSHPTDLELWADLDTQMGKTFSLKGPVRLTGTALPELQDGKFSQLSLTSKLDMDAVALLAPGLFEKKAGVPCRMDFAAIATRTKRKLRSSRPNFLMPK